MKCLLIWRISILGGSFERGRYMCRCRPCEKYKENTTVIMNGQWGHDCYQHEIVCGACSNQISLFPPLVTDVPGMIRGCCCCCHTYVRRKSVEKKNKANKKRRESKGKEIKEREKGKKRRDKTRKASKDKTRGSKEIEKRKKSHLETLGTD